MRIHVIAIALIGTLTLAGCGGVGSLRDDAGDAASSAAHAAASAVASAAATPGPLASVAAQASATPHPSVTASAVAAQVGTNAPSGDGSVSFTMTVPRAATLTVAATVDCAVDGRIYSASTDAGGDNAAIAFDLTAARYTGAGDYTFAGSLTVTAGGQTTSTPLVAYGSIGSDLSGSIVADNDQLQATLSWTCG
ncbi:hypothetical protein [Demequina capsici]|uniref:Lipoprotein n=1 Tax=Demequina capsici TaxID=3075620 RepID=A0AA96J6X4_9MICO|nr:hypothetical protein [Demequina sp. OYTSA14]WNM23745.1 hypothetical protein RN606_10280 [Demequina sp. OYTSA14]